MKKLFLVCLMMLAGSAWAKWLMYFEDKKIIYYYDPATIRKDGNIRLVWRVQERARSHGFELQLLPIIGTIFFYQTITYC